MEEQTLRKLYLKQGFSQTKVADVLDTSRYEVRKNLEKYDIPTHSNGGKSESAKWKDPDWLSEKYHSENLTVSEIAELCDDCTTMAIHQQMEKLGVERRSSTHQRKVCDLRTTEHGYEAWKPGIGGDVFTVYHHRLLAVAYHGVDAIKDKEIHHKNEVPWDNRPDNIEIMTPSEHMAHHQRKRGNN